MSTALTDFDREAALAALAWQVEMGVDEAIGEVPADRFAAAERQPQAGVPAPVVIPVSRPGPATVAENSADIAASCSDLAALRSALESFEGSALKKGARSTVFADGRPDARLMIVGEAPGREEDAAGLPFVGRSGRLLDRMLAAIGLARDAETREHAVYITNVLPWRPPVNRDPAGDEVALLKPFLLRHIELASPEVLLLMGARAAQVVLETNDGIGRLRGRWTTWREVAVLPTLHPALLLRDPSRKRQAWADLMAVRARLDGETE
jgi:uracil-DNA glycosylase family 4